MDGKTVLVILIVLVVAGVLFTGKAPITESKGVKGTFDLSFVYSASGGNVTDVSDVAVNPDVSAASGWFKSGHRVVFQLDSATPDITDSVNVTVIVSLDGNVSETLHSTSLGDKKISVEFWNLESGEHTITLDIYVTVTRGNTTVVSKEFTRSYTVTVP